MTLDNLVGLSLERITPDTSTIKRLLAAAERNLQDANIPELSNENRFYTAYKAIMQMANAALQARGYRTLTSSPAITKPCCNACQKLWAWSCIS